MKKSIMGVLTLLWVSMIILGGCSSSPKAKIFSIESPQKITVTSISGEKIEIIDEEIKQQITENITSIQFERGESSKDTNGFGSMISWYNSNGDVIETISVMSNDTIIYNNYFWTAINGSIDMEVINATLSIDTSLLDGVTMEVTEYSDTSVTVRIVNDTDKDIECGSDFCLEMQDEETGEWRELDEVIDNAGFTMEAYLIQKDSPYEAVIDFQWLYGKLEPGRYRIIKSITDLKGTGDYTDYAYTAEFSIEEDSDIVNAEELADTFGILILLPENTTWIADSEYYLVDENNLRISYHDFVADADCTLLVSKNNNLNLPQAEYDETLNESWEGYTIGRQHIVVKVQHENNDEKIVLATWEYNEYQFAIIGEDVNDSTPIPKVALYIIGKLA